MDNKSNSAQDLEQFYKLLADYGLTGSTQHGRLGNHPNSDELDDLFSN